MWGAGQISWPCFLDLRCKISSDSWTRRHLNPMAKTDRSVDETTVEGLTATAVRSEWGMAWRRLRRNWAAMIGGVVLLVFAVFAVLADVIAPEPINAMPNFENRFLPPFSVGTRVPPGGELEDAFFLFGTDDIGRDVFSRVVHGSRISLRVGLVAVLLAGAGGTLLGLAAGYFGGWPDMVISRALDVLLAFPGLLLAIVIVASLGPGLENAMIALGVAGIPFYARVVRGSTLSAREFAYVRAARAIGMRDSRIIIRHILPNILSPILIMSTLGLGSTIISAAGLSFLGLGASPPTPEWGLEISQYRAVIATAPWISVVNGVALALAVLSFNMLGDGLREALDPQASAWSQ